jgi:hypothetical protein
MKKIYLISESAYNELKEAIKAKRLSGKMSQSLMSQRYPTFNYHLQYGYLMNVPLKKIDGLDPSPETWLDDNDEEREFKKGNEIGNKPIELYWDSDTDTFMMYDGNHRYKQAKINGDTHILALVQPDNLSNFLTKY